MQRLQYQNYGCQVCLLSAYVRIVWGEYAIIQALELQEGREGSGFAFRIEVENQEFKAEGWVLEVLQLCIWK